LIVDRCNDAVHRLCLDDGREYEEAEGQAYSRKRAAKTTRGGYRPVDSGGDEC
jgi:hypothetical protein